MTPGIKRKRWCAGCGEAHGAVNVARRMCEVCGSEQAHYSLAWEKRKRWCAGCGKAHEAVDVANRDTETLTRFTKRAHDSIYVL
eukprot:SAG11_NODE_1070_length_5978_cov_2.893689_2_plen_84_part_00